MFKPGDRVVIINPEVGCPYGAYATVTEPDLEYGYDFIVDVGGVPYYAYTNEIISRDIYNSPVYKLLTISTI